MMQLPYQPLEVATATCEGLVVLAGPRVRVTVRPQAHPQIKYQDLPPVDGILLGVTTLLA